MAYPQLYIGQIPASAAERRVLRERALDLHAALRAGARGRPDSEPTYLLLNFVHGAAPAPVDLLLLRPRAAIVAAVREYPGPIEVMPGGRWIDLASGDAIRDTRGGTPLQVVRTQRDAVREQLEQASARLIDLTPDQPAPGARSGLELAPPANARLFGRMAGALICSPAMHSESRISLDVDDHRQLLKILGLDELGGLASMLRLGVMLSEAAMRLIVGELFAGRLWHNGEQLLFELAPGRFQLRLLGHGDLAGAVLPLIEGENVVGRRKTARRHERRITLSSDDLISSDHARIVCGDGDQVALRDMSKNGTYLIQPDGAEERLRGEERMAAPGALLRMGVTRLRLERAGE